MRWAVIGGWVVLPWLLMALLPNAPGEVGGGVDGLVPGGSPAIQTEVRSYQLFQLPLLSRTAIVQRDPQGMELSTQVEAVERAARVTRGEYDGLGPVVAAIPVPNTPLLFPDAREANTTVLTWFFTPPSVSFGGQYAGAQEFADKHIPADSDLAGVTGSVPARVEQGRVVNDSLKTVEFVTLAAVLAIVAVVFRSLVAPLVTLAVAGTGVLVMLEVAAAAGAVANVSVPTEMEPLLVALLLGVVTDYLVFYLAGTRAGIAEGMASAAAVQRATARFTPIVTVAGLTVAAGTACLLVADSPLFRAFGPGMALTVLVGLATAVTLAPALLSVLGPRAFWPNKPGATRGRRLPMNLDRFSAANRTTWLVKRRNAGWVLAVSAVVLFLAALPVAGLKLGVAFVPSLPVDNDVRQAALAAKAGFADGILSPTVLLVEDEGVTAQRDALARLGRALKQRPGVAGILGPGDQPLDTELGVLLARSGDAARYLIVLDDDPLDAKAIDTLNSLEADLPVMLGEAGLADARVGLAGDTAIAATIVDNTVADLERIAVAALAVNLLLLVLFLRSLLAPLMLLTVNALTLVATLGLTTLLFQTVLGNDGLTFYVPFAAAVLLLALGSDYTIFGVGHVWDEARRRPLRAALIIAVPRTARAITAAGFILAVSFGVLALIPLRPFRELAFAMFIGILIDSVVVRSVVVPSLLGLVGGASGWPGRYLYERQGAVGDRPAAVADIQEQGTVPS